VSAIDIRRLAIYQQRGEGNTRLGTPRDISAPWTAFQKVHSRTNLNGDVVTQQKQIMSHVQSMAQKHTDAIEALKATVEKETPLEE